MEIEAILVGYFLLLCFIVAYIVSFRKRGTFWQAVTVSTLKKLDREATEAELQANREQKFPHRKGSVAREAFQAWLVTGTMASILLVGLRWDDWSVRDDIKCAIGCYIFWAAFGILFYEFRKWSPNVQQRAIYLRRQAAAAAATFERQMLEHKAKTKPKPVAQKIEIILPFSQAEPNFASGSVMALRTKTHRIYTEDMNREGIVRVLDAYFKSYNVTETLGRWEGTSEKSLMIEVTGATLAEANKAGLEICVMNKQEAVLVTEQDGSMELLRPTKLKLA